MTTRVDCPLCKKKVALNIDGTLRSHGFRHSGYDLVGGCDASGYHLNEIGKKVIKVAKFKKKPIEIEAIQWAGDNIDAIWDAFTATCIYGPTEKNPDCLILETTEGHMNCPVGWWVIKGVEGEIYSCKDSIFKATYEQIDW